MRRKPQLLFVSCPHGDSQETSTRSSSLWGALHVLPVLPVFPHTHGKSPLPGTDPPPVTELHPAHPNPMGAQPLAKSVWVIQHPRGIWKREGNLNVLHPGWFPVLHSGEDFLCPIHLCFGDFPSSHSHPCSSSGSSSLHIPMAIVFPALWNRF